MAKDFGNDYLFKREPVRQPEGVAHLDKLLLDGFPDRNALVPSFEPGQIFLFSGCIDPVFAGRKGGGAQLPQDIPVVFLKLSAPRNASVSIAIKKCPRWYGTFSPCSPSPVSIFM